MNRPEPPAQLFAFLPISGTDYATDAVFLPVNLSQLRDFNTDFS